MILIKLMKPTVSVIPMQKNNVNSSQADLLG